VDQINGEWMVCTHGGRRPTDKRAMDWAKQAEEMGAGELLLTSMRADGTRNGFSLEITSNIARAVGIPLIASGGAGSMEHFKEVFLQTEATGALAASVFHELQIHIQTLKNYLKNHKIPVR
jgi:cyclase